MNGKRFAESWDGQTDIIVANEQAICYRSALLTGYVGQVRRDGRDNIFKDPADPSILEKDSKVQFAEKYIVIHWIDSLATVPSLFLCLPSARHAISRGQKWPQKPQRSEWTARENASGRWSWRSRKSREEGRREEDCIVADYIRERGDTRFACKCVGYVWTVWKIKGASRQTEFQARCSGAFTGDKKLKFCDKFRRFRG